MVCACALPDDRACHARPLRTDDGDTLLSSMTQDCDSDWRLKLNFRLGPVAAICAHVVGGTDTLHRVVSACHGGMG